jgi:sugar (pentulose or hexulose) kinase
VRRGFIIVLDVGKSLSKLTLWSPGRHMVSRRVRVNLSRTTDDFLYLDTPGITAWLEEVLAEFARMGDIAAIIPVGHGAAACLVDDMRISLPPLDYEARLPADLSDGYRAARDPFDLTGSPSLPGGLNLGAQLFWLENTEPSRARQARILTWPQYWAWLLCGIAATEVTSLGCHSDLWMPRTAEPSPLAVSRGWAGRLAPRRQAGDILGPVSDVWRNRCSLPKDCVVLCGVHDSNAALLAARQYPEIAGGACTMLSTGTWFIAMRRLAHDATLDFTSLTEDRDCLVNVDAFGTLVPSARFMGGREAEILEDGPAIDARSSEEDLLRITTKMTSAHVFALPAFQNGVGAFPRSRGGWTARPRNQMERRAVTSLYLALMADTSLNLIGSQERLVIEGRFAADTVFARALAALRPNQTIYRSQIIDNVPLGALQLVDDRLPPQSALTQVAPLDSDLSGYAAQWRAMANERPHAA